MNAINAVTAVTAVTAVRTPAQRKFDDGPVRRREQVLGDGRMQERYRWLSRRNRYPRNMCLKLLESILLFDRVEPYIETRN